jgi:uncharacterized membrane protein
MKDKIIVFMISVYKFLINFLRISIGALLIYSGCDINRLFNTLFKEELIEDSTDLIFYYLTSHIKETSFSLTCFLALLIIFLSTLELFFIVAFIYRKKWGALGFFVISISWVPVELLFISRFLIMPKVLSLFIDFLIIVFLFKLLTHPKGYFNKVHK